MSALDTAFRTLVIVGHHAIALTERAVVDRERVLELRVDDVSRGDVSLFAPYPPGIAVSDAHVAVWAGLHLYMAPLAGGRLARYPQDEEVHATYPVGALWCLVRELSVTLFDPFAGREVARYGHIEVLIDHRWSADRLLIGDFEGRRLVFQLPPGRTELTPEFDARIADPAVLPD